MVVQWKDGWLQDKDANNIIIGLWASKKDSKNFHCSLCNTNLRFDSQGGQALKQHSKMSLHKKNSNLRFSQRQTYFVAAANNSTTSSATATTASKTIHYDSTTHETKVKNAEAIWLFKVAQSDWSFNSCENTPELFKNMFTDSTISNSFTMSRWKASYCVSDALGRLVKDKLCEEVSKSPATFTILFDETTTVQVRRQMDVLIRFWSDREVKTRYLTSLFFGRAPAVDLLKLFKQMMEDSTFNIPWGKFSNTSSDSPAVNKKFHRILNAHMKEQYTHELLPFVPCTLHVVHNAFHAGIRSLPLDVDEIYI